MHPLGLWLRQRNAGQSYAVHIMYSQFISQFLLIISCACVAFVKKESDIWDLKRKAGFNVTSGVSTTVQAV